MISIRVKNEAVGRKVGDKFFIIPTTSEVSDMGGLFETNEVGSFIWESIRVKGETDSGVLQHEVGERFEVKDRNQLQEDIHEFLATLTEVNLIEIRQSGE